METTMFFARVEGGQLRRLWPSDLEAFRDHLLRLDDKSRFDRFAMVTSDDFMRAYAGRCFGIDDVIFGYFVDGVLRGAGELRPVAPGAHDASAEAAFSVETGWRRRGIGTALMERIVQAARNRSADTLYMSCLARNEAMQGLAKKFAADLQFDDDALTGKLVARTPKAQALWDEWLEESTNYATAMLDLQSRLFTMRRDAV